MKQTPSIIQKNERNKVGRNFFSSQLTGSVELVVFVTLPDDEADEVVDVVSLPGCNSVFVVISGMAMEFLLFVLCRLTSKVTGRRPRDIEDANRAARRSG